MVMVGTLTPKFDEFELMVSGLLDFMIVTNKS